MLKKEKMVEFADKIRKKVEKKIKKKNLFMLLSAKYFAHLLQCGNFFYDTRILHEFLRRNNVK